MIIKVCGMREPDNIRRVSELDIDMIGFIFWGKSPRYVSNELSHAGIIPDRACKGIYDEIKQKTVSSVGVFVDELPQTVITQTYNYRFDYIQLHGSESRIYIENLRHTLVPDIVPEIKIIKAFAIQDSRDMELYKEYEGSADMFLFDTKNSMPGGNGEKFDWNIIFDSYTGNTPFLLSGGIDLPDTGTILAINHPRFAGVDVNSKFETAPALKDIDKLKKFVETIRKNERDQQNKPPVC